MEIRAPLAGTVFRVLVNDGDTVSGGDTVIVLESMKMEIEVKADAAGTVQEVRYAEGDVVQGDEILVVLGP